MGRLPYEKQYELAYQIYEALCAQHPDRLVALSDTRAVFQARAAAALATRPPSGERKPKSTGSAEARIADDAAATSLRRGCTRPAPS